LLTLRAAFAAADATELDNRLFPDETLALFKLKSELLMISRL